ncbi:MAG: T9SS type A sorting domain-containing protein, partial [Flavobacteriales bacterium]|nr:T9SS type A sorting domain-containing protein [Flavobacteriales bacterium]
TATLAGNNPSPGFGAWSVIAGTGTVTTPASATSGVTGLTPGASSTFRWTVGNGVCASISDDVIITSYPSPTATGTPTNATCNGSCDGMIFLSTAGGTAPYTYLWSNAATTQNISGLCAGTYEVTVTDANGCTAFDSLGVTEPAAMTQASSYTDNTCFGSCDGTATITTVLGGTGAYTYLWDDPSAQTNAAAVGLCAGTYTCNITDANGCTLPVVKVISEPPALALTMSGTNASCPGTCDGTSTATAAGGVSPYTFLWDNAATTQTITSLCAGGRVVTVTDNNGCQVIDTDTVLDPAAITSSSSVSICAGDSIMLSGAFQTNAGVYVDLWTPVGGCDSTVTTTLTVNALPTPNLGPDSTVVSSTTLDAGVYAAYIWSTGDTIQMITISVTGTYSVVVTDANGCTGTDAVLITVIPPAGPTASATPTSATCNGVCDGTGIGTATGGTLPYTYSWNDPMAQTNATAVGLCAGTYMFVVIDALALSDTASIIVTEPAAISTSNSPTICSGDSLFAGSAYQTTTGTYIDTMVSVGGCDSVVTTNLTVSAPITVNLGPDTTVIGGITLDAGAGFVSYLWSTAETTQTILVSSSGTYSVVVTDAGACTGNDAVVVTVNALAPTVSASGTNASCNGICDGTATGTAAGGTPPYTYLWDDPGAQTSATAVGLCAGTYSIVVTDASSGMDTAFVTITEPTMITVSATSSDVSSCGLSDGSISLTVTGGVAPMTYLWSNGTTAQNAVGLPAGTYSVSVIDSAGCSGNASGVVNEPPSMTLSDVMTQVSCAGGSDGNVDLTVAGGTAPYAFLWSDGTTTEDLSNAIEGTYTVMVTDANGCSSTLSSTVTAITSMTLTMSSLDASSCGANDASANVGVSGGTAPFDYTWSNGDTTSSASMLPSGVHYVSVVDANNCIAYGTVTISELGGPTLTVNSVTDNNCNGDGVGAVDVLTTGGTAPYTYVWTHGATTEDIGGLIGAIYELVVEDAAGCLASVSATVLEPSALTSTSTTTDASCSGFDGSGTLTVTGGSPPYNYLWSNSGTTSSQTGLAAGVYGVLVTDANGCGMATSVAINNLGGPSVTVDAVNHVNCNFPNNGSIDIGVTGGFTPYTYTWSNGASTEDLSGLSDTIYNLTVSDANGCIAASSVEVEYEAPQGVEICIITVDSLTGKNLIVWEKDPGAGIDHYNLYKEGTVSGVYLLLAQIPYDSLSAYVDVTADPLQRSWRYKITAGDTCLNNIESDLSPMHKSIHLTVNQGLGGEINLIWDHYEGFNFGTYIIYRGATLLTMDSIAALPSNLNSYSDLTPPGGTLFYQIAAVHPTGCVATKAKNFNSSKSNTSSISTIVALSATITTTDSDPTNCTGTATATPIGGAAPYTYQWGPNATNQTVQTALALCAGSYAVTVTDADGNFVSYIATVIPLATGILEQSMFGEINLYPNPNTGKFDLIFSNTLTFEAVVTVYDVLGQKIKVVDLESNHTKIDLVSPEPGVYMVRIEMEFGSVTKRMVIE